MLLNGRFLFAYRIAYFSCLQVYVSTSAKYSSFLISTGLFYLFVLEHRLTLSFDKDLPLSFIEPL